jgi:DDE superfamily endonuclease
MDANYAIEKEGKPAGSTDRKNRQRRIYAGRRTPSRLWGAVEAVGERHGARPFNNMFLKIEELPDIIWAFSPKGWTDSELAVDWLRRVFVLKTSKQGRHSILIVDNHNSHITREF